MRSVVISSGHGKKIRGASKYLDEVDCARDVVDSVADLLRAAGATFKTFHDDTSTTQSTNLSTIVNYHNSQKRDLDVSVHFNAYQTTSKPMGVEVLYVTQQKLASDLSLALSKALGLPNRGGKKRTDLYFLNNTSKPSILIEVCFVDSTADAESYRNNFNGVCDAIAEHIAEIKVPGEPFPPEPIVPPEPPPEVDGVVDIIIATDGAVRFTLNGDPFEVVETRTDVPVVHLTIKAQDAVVTINGQDFQIDTGEEPPSVEPPPETDWQTGITTTVFGGAADPNNSAYPPYGYINDTVLACALPWRFQGQRPMIEVRNTENGKTALVEIIDIGPWMIDDDYWITNARPIAETCFINKEPLPRGPNKGRVPSNTAGLDLTPAAAKAIGLSGKGVCDWRFANAPEVA